MDLESLKSSIEHRDLSTISTFIFTYIDNDFLPMQYTKAIADILQVDVNFEEEISKYLVKSFDIFGVSELKTQLDVVEVDNLDITDKQLLDNKNLIIICKKISNNSKEIFAERIVEFPKLDKWQIKDYVYSICEGIDEKKLDYFIDLCGWNIYRIDKELLKFKIFNSNERKYVFDKFLSDGVLDDLSQHNVFDFSNAILKKDFKSLAALYSEIEKIDCEPLGLVTTLYNNIKSIISIQCSPNASPESTGIPSNRFWAIKKNMCGYYSKDQLLKMFELLTSIDSRIKTGDMPMPILIDYLVCEILSY